VNCRSQIPYAYFWPYLCWYSVHHKHILTLLSEVKKGWWFLIFRLSWKNEWISLIAFINCHFPTKCILTMTNFNPTYLQTKMAIRWRLAYSILSQNSVSCNINSLQQILKFKIQCLALEKYLKASYRKIKYIKWLQNRNYFQYARFSVHSFPLACECSRRQPY